MLPPSIGRQLQLRGSRPVPGETRGAIPRVYSLPDTCALPTGRRAGFGIRHPYLGFKFLKYRGQYRIGLSRDSLRREKRRLRVLTDRHAPGRLAERIHQVNRYLAGWMGYFALVATPTPLRDLDSWIRHRFRAMVWRRWKKSRTRLRELRVLGVKEWRAWELAMSRKGGGEQGRGKGQFAHVLQRLTRVNHLVPRSVFVLASVLRCHVVLASVVHVGNFVCGRPASHVLSVDTPLYFARPSVVAPLGAVAGLPDHLCYHLSRCSASRDNVKPKNTSLFPAYSHRPDSERAMMGSSKYFHVPM